MSAPKHDGIVSGRIFVCLIAALALSGTAYAGCMQTFGNTAYHNYDGKVGTSQTVGATAVYNIDGELGLPQTVSDITVHSGSLFNNP